ncbi:MAG: TRAM domain-containing protein, partial [Candidatus Atribacteria bacterium]|nr:TRAM domain-containing protein [Candidatus Atribacteria bacterium]
MNRKIGKKDIEKIINKSRKKIPNLALRTTFIVGFPGETDKDFEELLNYIKEVKFDKLGVFTYSREKGTPAYDFSHQISLKVKKQRMETIMMAQQKISKEKNNSFLGKVKDVLIDEIDKNDNFMAIGRTMTDAPEIDGKVFVNIDNTKDKAKVGEFVKTKIIDASEYDLFGELA